MKTLFISDLHLEENRPEMAELFINFLINEAIQADALYILGDFFEAWIGDDDLTPFHQKIIAALRSVTQKGLPVYMMHGNRDFLLGKRFMRATGCQLLPDEKVINLYGTPTLLLHGDTLCTQDVKYLKFRKKSRTWLYKKLASLKSLESRRAIAAKMRASSKEHMRNLADYMMDVTQEEVEHVMQRRQVQHLIHGHTHREGVHHFTINNQPATRTVLGAWHEHGYVLICDNTGKQEPIII
jgi:UDP-2,3-diacylglucosamine hydrolase